MKPASMNTTSMNTASRNAINVNATPLLLHLKLPGWDLSDERDTVRLYVAVILTTALALIFVAMRIWARFKIMHNSGWDDYCCIAAMLGSLGASLLVLMEIDYGLGRHLHYVVHDFGQNGLRISIILGFTCQALFGYSLAFVKVSVGLFLLRFVQNRWYKGIIWILLSLIAMYFLSGLGFMVVKCRPVVRMMHGYVVGSCYATPLWRDLTFVQTVCNIFTDFVFTILPFPLFWTMQINTRTKFTLYVTFSVGFLAAASSIVKLFCLLKINHIQGGMVSVGAAVDYSWVSVSLAKWVSIETNIAIIAASMPTLKPLFRKLLEAKIKFCIRTTRKVQTCPAVMQERRTYGSLDFTLMRSTTATVISHHPLYDEEKRIREISQFDLPRFSDGTVDRGNVRVTSEVNVTYSDTGTIEGEENTSTKSLPSIVGAPESLLSHRYRLCFWQGRTVFGWKKTTY
ncbi:hypothetical protein BJ875DRAFT_524848 [Amylocarpus encephaloides]|uniref:Rhodopsin domain-containing protein n=1 Tax=Amylocarpus encephaloides TaxID=45428 RepID=A0A9P7Y958_9HELO|nr:hypothetical protein BJ875DRAFT_524848 [Amylocarpus encephaloides]